MSLLDSYRSLYQFPVFHNNRYCKDECIIALQQLKCIICWFFINNTQKCSAVVDRNEN